MKKTGWMNCRESPPIRVGWYEVRMWENFGIKNSNRFLEVVRLYFDGKWGDKDYIFTGQDRPGWHEKDEWRGVLK